jgi:putative oxidoreductase
MKNARTVIRFLLALALAVFGVDKFLHFMPPPEAPPEGGAFLGALADAGYVFPAIGLAFLATSVCLLAARVARGLILLRPSPSTSSSTTFDTTWRGLELVR